MNDERTHAALLAVIGRAWDEGCPIAGPDGRDRLARSAIRRWRSFAHRTRERHPSTEARIEDLAKGLRDSLEADRNIGPLMEDYRYLARLLVPVLESS